MEHVENPEMSKRRFLAGFLITLFLSTLLLYVFFGDLLKTPNEVFFAKSGDGLKSYYGTMYHIRYDTSYFRFQGMNYPYGESVFFTDNQPAIANLIKFVSENITDISGYTVGIINLLMLLSIVLAAVFIYLIFSSLRLNFIYSSLISVIIAFLSPQIGRLGGHFSLSYVFMIPLLLYLLIRFYRKPCINTSIIIGFVSLFAGLTHLYYLGFYGLILVFFWGMILISEKNKTGNRYNQLKHIFIQLILPFLLIKILLLLTDQVGDRTSNPWGFLFYRAYPESVFLPVGKPYGRFLDKIMTFRHIDWEGYAYIGLIALAGFIIILKNIFSKIVKKHFKDILAVTDNKILNIFFWASFVGLLYSFGLPFIIKMEFLVDYIGPLKQMRGIARFSWIFFYVVNIVGFYIIWQWANKQKRNLLKYIIIVFVIIFSGYDAWLNSRNYEANLNNKISAINDFDNELPENKWIEKINPEKYQAVLPVPYFHIGSENWWLGSKCDIAKNCLILSLKTGLPTTGVLLGRTSLSQTVKNMQIFSEPYRPLDIIHDFPNEKPFLILEAICDEQNENEKNLVSMSELILSRENFNLYELKYEKLKHISDSLYYYNIVEFEETEKMWKYEDLYYSDSIRSFVYKSFNETDSEIFYHGKGGYNGRIKDYNIIFNDTLPYYNNKIDYTASFWFSNAINDLFPRTTMEILYIDSSNNIYNQEYKYTGEYYSIIDRNWALIEYPFRLRNKSDKIKITLWNWDLRRENIYVDELLIRPSKDNIYKKQSGVLMKNTRIFPQD